MPQSEKLCSVLPRGPKTFAIEDMIRRKMNERNADRRASSGNIFRSDRIDPVGTLHVRFRVVNRRIGRAIDHNATGLDGTLHCTKVGDVAFGAPQRGMGNGCLTRPCGKRPADLPPLCSKDQQPCRRPRGAWSRSLDATASCRISINFGALHCTE